MKPDIRVYADSPAVARAAAELVVDRARSASSAERNFSMALSGGSTPKLLFQLLAAEPFRSQIDWGRVEIFFGDERAVPPEHADSNFKMANEALLSLVPLKAENIHRMRGEIDPNEAAIEYGKLLKAKFGEGGVDLMFLGMGDDGHTASLFPNTPVLSETHHRCVGYLAENSTTGRSWRITMTAPFINRSAEVVMLITGASKAARLNEVLFGPRDPMRMPIQLIEPVSGNVIWMLDAAAATQLNLVLRYGDD
jgi:6-phosphogluconolactonase